MKKILFISNEAIGFSVAKHLADKGNDVCYYCRSDEQKSVGTGLKNPVRVNAPTFKPKENDKNPKKTEEAFFKTLMAYLRPYLKGCDFTFFDDSGMGKLADIIMAQGYKVVGSSSFMDELEVNRVMAYDIMKKYTSIKIPDYEQFDSIKKGIAFLEKEYGDRYVFKLFDDGGEKSLTYMSIDDDNESLIEYMQTIEEDKHKFVLQKIIPGKFEEISSEGWFDGNRFVDGAFNHTMEKKRLMDHDTGPQTGCSGSIVWECDPNKIIRTALIPLTPYLKANKYVGPIDVNLIIQDEEAYFLEFTSRCGYHAIEQFFMLLQDDPGEFLYNLAYGIKQTVNLSSEYALAVALSTYPLEGDPEDQNLWEGVKLLDISEKQEPYFFLQCSYWDEKGVARATGTGGSVGAVVSTGETIEKAKSKVYDLIEKCAWTKDLMFRHDIGDKVNDQIEELEEAGWL